MGKYTLTGSKEFDELVDEQLALITEEILKLIPEEDIAAILLGGGYGRGEGGIVIEDKKEYLYNDYDLFVILKNISYFKKKKYQEKIHYIHEKFTPLFKIDVDVGPLQTVKAISKTPHWMMWYELKNGHKVLWGNQSIKNYFPDYSHEKMPIMEAYRLLLNRGVGLILCKEHFKSYEEEESQEFILRNIRKAQLAMGDAFLIKKERFHFSYKKRDEIFSELKEDEDLLKLGIFDYYKTAYQFKEFPHKVNLSKEDYLAEYKQTLLVYEGLFNWVFNDEFAPVLNLKGYQDIIEKIFSEESSIFEKIKNVCKNTKINYNNLSSKSKFKHPRFMLFMALPYFLFSKQEINCQEILNCNKCQNEDELLKIFVKLWEQNN